ncbi:MAG: transglutaminase domain-containing protein [Desulfosarcinaceae bacterium]|nr:transglutaminase domain-containing protein [Desulfosarcinaceae bacterium]
MIGHAVTQVTTGRPDWQAVARLRQRPSRASSPALASKEEEKRLGTGHAKVEDVIFIVNNQQPAALDNVLFITLDYAIAKYGINIRDLDEHIPNTGYNNIWLQFPNREIEKLAFQIVDRSDSNDTKLWKIASWVIDNIGYLSDEENYGYEELWAPPIWTLSKELGDCEDGAFLIHSLALNAGVPADRLRTYGGEVKTGIGAMSAGPLAGHGWTAYRRERDNEWVVVDFSYYPNYKPMSSRIPMKEDERYVEDFWYMDLREWVNTPYSNRIREPEPAVYNQFASWDLVAMIRGSLVNTYG